MAKYEIKTKVEPITAQAFIDAMDNPKRQSEARALLSIYGKASGYPAQVYTGGMIGFGSYTYETAGCIGTIFATGFAPRKAELSLYGLQDKLVGPDDLARLGKVRAGVSCVYARRLSEVDHGVLAELISSVLDRFRNRHTVTPV
jgi:hypothetical protein